MKEATIQNPTPPPYAFAPKLPIVQRPTGADTTSQRAPELMCFKAPLWQRKNDKQTQFSTSRPRVRRMKKAL